MAGANAPDLQTSAPPVSWLDQQVRQLDPGRWLTSRFVRDPVRREDVLAIYAFEAELAAIPTRVSQPLLAEMRLRWWSDQLDGVFSGQPRKGHPILEALSAAAHRHDLDREAFAAVIESRIERVHGEAADVQALAVGPMRQAARVLGAHGDEPAIEPAARLYWATQAGDCDAWATLRHQTNERLRRFPVAAFPALLPAALGVGTDSPLRLRLRLVWATLLGRI